MLEIAFLILVVLGWILAAGGVLFWLPQKLFGLERLGVYGQFQRNASSIVLSFSLALLSGSLIEYSSDRSAGQVTKRPKLSFSQLKVVEANLHSVARLLDQPLEVPAEVPQVSKSDTSGCNRHLCRESKKLLEQVKASSPGSRSVKKQKRFKKKLARIQADLKEQERALSNFCSVE